MTLPEKLPKVSHGQMETDMRDKIMKKRMSPGGGISAFALGVAKVVTVNYEEFLVTLRILIGDDQEFQRSPIPLTFPGAGKRLFLGAMPQVGDFCVVGWMPQESGGSGDTVGTKTPVILSWILPGVTSGFDWLTTQPFRHDEFSFSTKDSTMVEGAFERVRHKLRHIQPGNIVASSAQGSDIVLDEGVLISNRRCNEIRLRDADQALVVRTLQQFHAMAGVRSYAGMVQRDAGYLPTQLFSDGLDWDHPTQTSVNNNGSQEPLNESDLLEDIFPDGFLTPDKIFQRSPQPDGSLSRPNGPPLAANIDPYQFLKNGLFLDEDGFLTSGDVLPDAVYGGKPIFRVALLNEEDNLPFNGLTNNDENSLTEYRLEISHTSDGVLPVTEQTDNFDADRLPRNNPKMVDRNVGRGEAPFIEIVYGSVVGNDPFSEEGLALYGLPISPLIFDESGSANPQMISGIGIPMEEHAAYLFRLTPPLDDEATDTFWSVQKSGQLKAFVGGDASENSVEAAFQGGFHLLVPGKTQLDLEGGVSIKTKKGDETSNIGIEISSDQAVKIYGGANSQIGQAAERNAPAGDGGANPSPSLLLEGRDTVEVKASQNIILRGSKTQVSGAEISLQALSSIDIQASDRVGVNTKVFDVNVAGKSSQNYSGPKDLLPTNGALRETQFTTAIPGLTVDKYSVNLGNREETFLVGNHSTTIRVGNMTYQTNVGTWKAQAGTNEISMNNFSGLSGNVVVGNVLLEAKAGAATLSGTLSALVKTNGQATVSGKLGVFLGGGPVAKTGIIVSSADLDPLSGLPLSTYGMGSPAHRIGSAI